MNLQEKLDALKKKNLAGMKPELATPLLEETAKLAQSGIADKAIKVGATLPEFTLPDEKGSLVGLKDLLAKGPLVISFYRGVW